MTKKMVENEIKYAVYPGWVRSKNDNDEHYIDFYALCRLYKVNPAECMMVIPNRFGPTVPEGLIVLVPRQDGNYDLPRA